MRILKNLTATAGLLAVIGLMLPGRAYAQHSGVEIWASTCGRCHTPQPPGRYTAKDWRAIMDHMTLNARLTDAQRDAVLAFLQQGAMTVAATAPDPVPVVESVQASLNLWPVALVADTGPTAKENFTKLCVPCHGKEGKGDGPAAVAFNPRPADFTTAEFWKDHPSDEDMKKHITEGLRLMPAFGEQLSVEEIGALVKYIHLLGGQKAGEPQQGTR
jgi:mono/diheme cytochrome c family protein